MNHAQRPWARLPNLGMALSAALIVSCSLRLSIQQTCRRRNPRRASPRHPLLWASNGSGPPGTRLDSFPEEETHRYSAQKCHPGILVFALLQNTQDHLRVRMLCIGRSSNGPNFGKTVHGRVPRVPVIALDGKTKRRSKTARDLEDGENGTTRVRRGIERLQCQPYWGPRAGACWAVISVPPRATSDRKAWGGNSPNTPCAPRRGAYHPIPMAASSLGSG